MGTIPRPNTAYFNCVPSKQKSLTYVATGVDGSSPIVVESFEGVSNGNQLHRRNVQSTVRPGLIPHLKFHMRIASEERVVSKVAPCTSGCDPGIPRADVTNATKRPTYIPSPLLFYLFTTQVVLMLLPRRTVRIPTSSMHSSRSNLSEHIRMYGRVRCTSCSVLRRTTTEPDTFFGSAFK